MVSPCATDSYGAAWGGLGTCGVSVTGELQVLHACGLAAANGQSYVLSQRRSIFVPRLGARQAQSRKLGNSLHGNYKNITHTGSAEVRST
jgi:hypothetical protein